MCVVNFTGLLQTAWLQFPLPYNTDWLESPLLIRHGHRTSLSRTQSTPSFDLAVYPPVQYVEIEMYHHRIRQGLRYSTSMSYANGHVRSI